MKIITYKIKLEDINNGVDCLAIVNPMNNINEFTIYKIQADVSSPTRIALLASQSDIEGVEFTDINNLKVGEPVFTTAKVLTSPQIKNFSILKHCYINQGIIQDIIRRDDALVLKTGYSIIIRAKTSDQLGELDITIGYDERPQINALQSGEEGE